MMMIKRLQSTPRRIARCCGVLGAVLLLTAAASTRADDAAYGSGAADYTLISEDAGDATVPNVAVDYLENSHIVWKRGSDLYYAKVGPNGQKLLTGGDGKSTAAVYLDSAMSATVLPAIAADYDGAAHIVVAGNESIQYIKVNPDGTVAFTKAVNFGLFTYATSEFKGADIAIDPTTNLPVIGTLAYESYPVYIGGEEFRKYKEKVYGLRLDAAGVITKKECYGWTSYTLGGPPGVFDPPSIAVDSTGQAHAVWKCREPQDGSHDGPPEESTDPGADQNQNKTQKYWRQNIHGVAWKAGDTTLLYSNTKKAATPINVLTIFVPGIVSGAIPLRINTPNDIATGTFLPAPRLVADGNARVHVVWYGIFTDGTTSSPCIRYSRIKSDGYGSGGGNVRAQIGTVERRSRVISSTDAAVLRANPDIALGDGVAHVVWVDARDTTHGSRIYHGAVGLASGEVQPAAEYAISLPRSTSATNPRISLRPNKVFNAWTGYDGDPHTGALDPFSASDPETLVNLYDDAISVTATFKSWPSGAACPNDPVIDLPGQGDGNTSEQVPISADDGVGSYSVVWQEAFTSSPDTVLHRKQYWSGVYGLWSHYRKPSGAWKRTDAVAAMGAGNLTSGTLVDTAIPLSNQYRELVRDANYHVAQGVVADGVTPLIIRCRVPAGEYYARIKAADDSGNTLAFMLARDRLQLYNHALSDFQDWQISGPQLTSVSAPGGRDTYESIFVVNGFDYTDPAFAWPLDESRVSLSLELFRKPVNGEGLNMVSDPPFASIPFAVAKPPIVLVHGYNAKSETWSNDFKKKLQESVGSDFVLSAEYGQEQIAVGILADLQSKVQEATGSAYTDTETLYNSVISPAKSYFDDTVGYLTDLGIIPEDDGDKPWYSIGGDGFNKFLEYAKKATFWEKAASAKASLTTLEKDISLKLFVIEETLRRDSQWAFSRYDAIGHCQGGVLLRMLCSNEQSGTLTTFLHERNFGRGRFRRVITVGSPHRGSRITQYCRLYQDHMLDEVIAQGDIPRDMIGFGLALMFYADRAGYLEKKFDPYDGEIVKINKDLPIHPKAKFHLASTVIDHDDAFVARMFAGIGLNRQAPAGYNLFDTVFNPIPGSPVRASDGLVDWRSHFAGVDFNDSANAGMLTNLDSLNVATASKIAAHIPPIPLTALTGEPGPASFSDVFGLFKDAVKGDVKSLFSTVAAGLLKQYADTSKASFSVFGTKNTQTDLVPLATHFAALLDTRIGSSGVDKTFGQFINYNPDTVTGAGTGNPDGDETLSNQELTLIAALRDKIHTIFDAQAKEYLQPYFTRAADTAPGTYRYRMTPPDEWPMAGDPTWDVTVVNSLVANSQGVELTVDPTDPRNVSLVLDENLYGNVMLHCSYFTATGKLIQFEPILVAACNQSTVVGIHFASFIPELAKGETATLGLMAEYANGDLGPFFVDRDDVAGVAWSSSDETVLSVATGGVITALAKTGTATITVRHGNLEASAEIVVTGIGPDVTLTAPLGPIDVTAGESLALQAVATDSDGTITDVVFYVNGQGLGKATLDSGHYNLTWQNLPAGTHEIYAVAVDSDGQLGYSESRSFEVPQRPPVIDSWPAPIAGGWYSRDVYCSVTASDPDGDEISVQFEYSLDSTNGIDGTWSQCYYPLTELPFDFQWESRPLDEVNDSVWLRVYAIDPSGAESERLTRMIKIDNSTTGLTFAPHPGEYGVPLNVQPTITFENPVVLSNGGAVTNADLSALLGFSKFTQAVPFSASINAEKTIITLVPNALFEGVSAYTVQLDAGLRDSVTAADLPRVAATFITTYGPPVVLAFARDPSGAVAGGNVAGPVRVAVVDAQGNTVRDNTATVTVALKSGAPLGGTLTLAAVAGVAEFADLSLTTTGSYVLTATAGGLTSADSAAFTVRPAELARLTVSLAEATVPAGTPVNVTVTAYDRFDNTKTDYIGTPNFRSTDTRALLPQPYTYYETDNGTHTYRLAFTPKTRGTQSLVAWDDNVASASAQIEVTNAAPATPIPSAPVDGQYTGLRPTLRFESFEDIDLATHAASHWQIATDADFSAITWDSGATAADIAVIIANGVLAEATSYWWRVRVKDSSGDAPTEWSQWSTPAQFKTAYALPFSDNFGSNKGWLGLRAGEWEIGPARAGGGQNGLPDPALDATDTEDNGVLGYNLGGDYLPNADATATSPAIDCSQAEIVELSFQRHLGVEGDDWGHASLLVSSDGTTWNTVWANPSDTVDDQEWTSLTYDITPYAAGKSTVFLRFSMGPMTMSYPYRGWNIDDLDVKAGAAGLVELSAVIPEQDIQVGDIFTLEVYVTEHSDDVSGVLGCIVDVDFPETLVHYYDPYYPKNAVQSPFTLYRTGAKNSDTVTGVGGATTETGHGDGAPVLLARMRFMADRAGTATFAITPALGGAALPPPLGQQAQWRINPVNVNVTLAADALEPLARVTTVVPNTSIALGNTFDVQLYVEEITSAANGVLGGVLDLYFDAVHVSCVNFDPQTAIQSPYTDVGLTSGTLLENRIDELGGATTASGHGNSTPKLFAVLTFRADALGEAVFDARAGSAAFTLTSPVGQLDFSRIDYGPSAAVTIAPNFALALTGASDTTGNGNYTQGAVVTIQADPPETGRIFDHWEGDVGYVGDADSHTTTVTIPGTNINLTAVYRDVPYTLTVNNGSGGTTSATYLDEIEIQAKTPATGKQFDHWEGDTTHLLGTESTATVRMPAANVTLTAVYSDINYALSVANGTGDTTQAIYQQRIQIAADAAPIGYRFDHWAGDTESLDSTTATPVTLTMPAGNVSVTAIYTNILYTLTVTDGTGDSTEATYQQEIEIQANAPVMGQEFDRWTGDVGWLDHPETTPATVTMPAQNVALSATYKDSHYTLTVNNGVGDTTAALYRQQIQIAAERPPIGQRFKEWQGDVAYLDDPQSESPTVTMPAGHVTLTAVFRNVYRLTVVDGTGTGDYPAGQRIPVTAIAPSVEAEFIEWTRDDAYLDANLAGTTFTMPARDAILIPSFTGQAGGGFCLIVLDGTGSGRYAAGEQVEIRSTLPAGTTFTQWGGMTEHFAGAITANPVTVTMPAADIAVRAIGDAPIIINGKQGWNLIAPNRDAINPATLAEYDGIILGPIWGWDGYTYFDTADENPNALNADGVVWHVANTLCQNHGYWMYLSQDILIVIP
jgi:hypothetical protein